MPIVRFPESKISAKNDDRKLRKIRYCTFCIDSVIAALDGMYKALMPKYGALPVVFSGGVTSNKRIKNYFHDKYNAIFAEPAFSADNAAGTAVLSSIIYDRRK